MFVLFAHSGGSVDSVVSQDLTSCAVSSVVQKFALILSLVAPKIVMQTVEGKTDKISVKIRIGKNEISNIWMYLSSWLAGGTGGFGVLLGRLLFIMRHIIAILSLFIFETYQLVLNCMRMPCSFLSEVHVIEIPPDPFLFICVVQCFFGIKDAQIKISNNLRCNCSTIILNSLIAMISSRSNRVNGAPSWPSLTIFRPYQWCPIVCMVPHRLRLSLLTNLFYTTSILLLQKN